MDEQKIRQMIRQEISKSDGGGRFGLKNIPHHTHNGIDSLPVFTPIFSYAGGVAYDASNNVLPKGWTATHDATGDYTVVHNLGTFLYGVVAIAAQSTNEIVIPIVSTFQNEFSISWFDTSDTRQNTSFNFVLTQINNRASPLTNYETGGLT